MSGLKFIENFKILSYQIPKTKFIREKLKLFLTNYKKFEEIIIRLFIIIKLFKLSNR